MNHCSLVSALRQIRDRLPAFAAAFALGATAQAQHSTLEPTMVTGLNGWQAEAIFTVGETINGTSGAYTPVGILDGIGAIEKDANTVRAFVTHELAAGVGTGYTTDSGVNYANGARISYFDIDKTTRQIVDSGLAFDNVYDRLGNLVTDSATQLEYGAFTRFCSAVLATTHQFGAGRGVEDDIFFVNEETSSRFGGPGGSAWAMDVDTGDLWAVPDFGRGAWENVTQVDTGREDTVAFMLGDDFGISGDGFQDGTDHAPPLYMYVGKKDASGNFLERNGLAGGSLHVWVPEDGDKTVTSFRGTGTSKNGSWVEIDNFSAGPALADDPSTPGVDESLLRTTEADGYANDRSLRAQADALGAQRFSRPEDLATNPLDGSQVVFASTGRDEIDEFTSGEGGLDNADEIGDTYVIDVDFAFDAQGNFDPANSGTSITNIYDGDDPTSNGLAAMGADDGLRSPDNLDWADNGLIYINEDRAESGNSATGTIFDDPSNEASIWELDPTNPGSATRIGMINRDAIPSADPAFDAPFSDLDADRVGEWETSGILDVSTLFGEEPGTLLLLDVQAHDLGDTRSSFVVGGQDLIESGQLVFLSTVPVPEPGSLVLLGLGSLVVARRRR